MSQIWSVAQEGPIEGVLVALQLLCFGVFGVLLSKADIASHRLPNRLVGSWLLASLALVICLGASKPGACWEFCKGSWGCCSSAADIC